MRTFFMSAVAAAFALLAPSAASAAVVGQLGLGYETTDFDFNSPFISDPSYDGPSISGAVLAPLHGDHWVIQGDARIQSESYDYGYPGADTYDDSNAHVALHVAYRDDSFAVGGFYAQENYFGDSIQEVGVEAQKYFSGVTIDASAAYGNHDGPYYAEYDAWDAQVGVTGFIGDNWSVEGTVGYAEFDYYYGKTELTTVSIAAEYQIPDSRFSVRAAYINGSADDTYADYDTDTFQIGLVMSLGGESAQERHNTGASLPGADAFDTHWRLLEAGYYSIE